MRIGWTLLFIGCLLNALSQPPEGLSAVHGVKVTPGYYFLSPMVPPAVSTDTSHAGWNLILDKNGDPVYYRKFTGSKKPTDLKIWNNTQLSYYLGDRYYLLDSGFRIGKEISIKHFQTDHHEILRKPDGTITLIGIETFTMDLRAYHFFNHHLHSAGSATALIVSGLIQEQDSTGNVIWEWHAKDHFDFNEVDSSFLSDPTKVDWTHINSVFLDHDGNYLISLRHFNQVVKVSRSTGEIIWRLGGKKNQFRFINDRLGFVGQHDVKKISATELSLYDNGKEGHPASFKSYRINESARTAELTQKYQPHSGNSRKGLGNNQQVKQGTLFNPGIHESLFFVFEVRDRKNQNLLTVSFNDTLRSYRVYHYDELPFRIKRPGLTLLNIDGKNYLEAEAGHKTYLWNTGENTRRIEVMKNKKYQVWIPAATGFVSSEVSKIAP